MILQRELLVRLTQDTKLEGVSVVSLSIIATDPPEDKNIPVHFLKAEMVLSAVNQPSVEKTKGMDVPGGGRVASCERGLTFSAGQKR